MPELEKNDQLYEAALALGWAGSASGDPDIEKIVGRYSFDAEEGIITGPSGKQLKAVYSPWAFSWRVGVYVDESSKRVNVGRLAFALTHGRWPVGIHFKNKKLNDVRASNLCEVKSAEFKKAEKYGVWPGQGVIVWTDRLDRTDAFNPRHRRGAVRLGRNVFDEKRRIENALKSEALTERERNKLRHAQRSYGAMCKLLQDAVDRELAQLKGASVAKPQQRRSSTLSDRLRSPTKAIRRISRGGPSKAIKRAARRAKKQRKLRFK